MIDSAQLGLLLPAFAAGLLVAATHVPLGIQVLQRGIVFIDLAVAQIAGLGVIVADRVGFEPHGAAVQVAALAAALTGALLLNWTERRWPDVQEAIIGAAFVLAATGATLALSASAHGAENLKELLVGQILWVGWQGLLLPAFAYALLLAVWFGLGQRLGRAGFYVVFACAVTISVQLVGLYLVFATLIIPALAVRRLKRGPIAAGYAIAAGGYLLGLAASLVFDLPPGPLTVWTLAVLAVAASVLRRRAAG